MEAFLQQLNFDLDPFQKEAMQSIEQGHSVVVCAPTGSGKTIIAEFAATEAIGRGVRLFYTTPLKALSNQKFFDFRAQFGDQNVGLLTGDISINRDARILVMTTEVFRNMLYGIEEESALLEHVGYVVLDECHFMNDAERGTVWEESIIYCPDTIQIIALSATVANAWELTNWINEVHHDTRLVMSDFRPVPLRFYYYNRENILPLFEAPGKLNKKLKTDLRGNRFSRQQKIFRPNALIQEMHDRDMLPAIFFTFSRKGCDKALRETRNIRLLKPHERDALKQKIDDYLIQNPFLKNNPMLEFIANGFASHHAGLLPGLKHLVETLFQQGLIKAVFATETLAAGINMPARSTVITSISKRTNDGHRLLTASEFLQMSGRAGRRGMDPVGNVVIVSTPFQGSQDAAILASSPADPLNSQFTPTYGMVLNLLQRHTLEQAKFLLSKSFGQFTVERRLKPLTDEIDRKSEELEKALGFTCPEGVNDKDFLGFLKSRMMLVETNKRLKILKSQLKKFGEAPELLEELRREEGKKASLLSTLRSSPCDVCKIVDKHERTDERIKRLQKSLKFLNERYQREGDTYWQSFLNIYNLLKELGHLSETDQPTPQGALTSQIRAENELFLSELIRQNILTDLSPDALAAVLCALVNDSTRDNLFAKLQPSNETRHALINIQAEIKRMRRLQEKHRVDVALILNPVASGLVEAWCQGLSWDRLVASTNIDEGDLVRHTRRTADLLRQLSRIPEVPVSLSQTAREALKRLYRDPIKEVDLTEESDNDIPASELETET